jgi:hypothetical protein
VPPAAAASAATVAPAQVKQAIREPLSDYALSPPMLRLPVIAELVVVYLQDRALVSAPETFSIDRLGARLEIRHQAFAEIEPAFCTTATGGTVVARAWGGPLQ